MLISVVNHTNGRKQVQDDVLQKVIRAINRQIAEDFAPVWGMSATLRLEGRSTKRANEKSPSDLRGDAILYLLTSIKDADGTLGFHDLNAKGIPFGFVYTEISEKLNEPWTRTFSHEAMELIADPEANLLVMGPHPKQRRMVFHWFEMCDAVQTQHYEIDGVELSNFVLPLYFTGTRKIDEKGARNNFLGTPLASFGITAGGYIGFYDPRTHKQPTVFGPDEEVGKRRSAVKARARKTRRAARYSSFARRLKALQS